MCYYKGKHGWQLEYLSMIRFRSVLLWRHPIFQYFDYVIQIDSDVAFLDIKLDLFEQIARKNKYGSLVFLTPTLKLMPPLGLLCFQGSWIFAVH
jgi:hypothetical protein